MNEAVTNSANPGKHLYLIDGYGFVFRAYHALPPMTRSDGTPVNAVYGFTNMLLKLRSKIEALDRNHPEDFYMAIVLDAGRKSFRNDISADYKANRPPPPEDLVPQFPMIRKAAEAMHIPALELEGYEADDLIATYTRIACEQGTKVTIVSSDKDLMQLVGGCVNMYDAMKEREIGTNEVVEKFGVPPEKVLDVLSLMGDSSDNIPGVPGIGPKTAAELILEFGSLEDVLERAGEIKQNKRREVLLANIEQAKLSKRLASLEMNVPLATPLDDLRVRPLDKDAITTFLRDNNFKSLLARMEQKGLSVPGNATLSGTPRVTPSSYAPAAEKSSEPAAKTSAIAAVVIKKPEELRHWLLTIKGTPRLAVTTWFDGEKLTALELAAAEDNACRFDVHESVAAGQASLLDFNQAPQNSLSLAEILPLLKSILEDQAVIKIGHDIKQLKRHLLTYGITVSPVEDIELLSYVLEGAATDHSMESLVLRDLGAEINNVAPAAAQIALARQLKTRLFAESMVSVYETIERPLIDVLARMEHVGVALDPEMLKRMSHEFGTRIAELEKEIQEDAGYEFNIGSPKQMGEVLFDKLQLPGGKKSKKSGAYGVDASVLEELNIAGYPIAGKILEWRMLSKLKNTYTDALYTHINSKTGRVHTTFQMALTSTGRLSSINPNLQNIPIRSNEGKKIRQAFVAGKDYTLISADYSQIELRLLAHMADIPALKDAFARGIDIHTLTASQVLGVPLDKVDANMRRSAKAVNFGLIYGQSAFGLAAGLGIPRGEAQRYIEAYFKQYPGIAEYMEKTREFAREHGYVTTFFGRKCYMPGIKDKNPARRQFAERAAINAPLQGTAADIIKRAMITLEKKLQGTGARMVLQIHDELLIESPPQNADQVAAIVKLAMQSAAALSVPLVVEVGQGRHWGEIH